MAIYSWSSIQNINKCGSGSEIALHNLINHQPDTDKV